jgi:hypothetical protein
MLWLLLKKVFSNLLQCFCEKWLKNIARTHKNRHNEFRGKHWHCLRIPSKSYMNARNPPQNIYHAIFWSFVIRPVNDHPGNYFPPQHIGISSLIQQFQNFSWNSETDKQSPWQLFFINWKWGWEFIKKTKRIFEKSCWSIWMF